MENEKKYCTNCGESLGPNVSFCSSCGEKVNPEIKEEVTKENIEKDTINENDKPKKSDTIVLNKKIVIVGIIAIIAIVGVVGGLFLMNGDLQISSSPFKNNLDVSFSENKEVENPVDPIEDWVYTGKVTYFVYVNGFTNLTKKELLDLDGYTIDTKILDSNGNILDAESTSINEYTYLYDGEISFGYLEIDNKTYADKVVVTITDDNGNVVQTIEKNV